jgi:hypothetical protein
MPLLYSFISKASILHNNKYDYSLTGYKHSKAKVDILCPIHGLFRQMPNDHLNGRGCPKCGAEKVASIKKDNFNIFVKKATQVHGDTYDYSLVTYVNSKQKIKIICSIHGTFDQSPNHHLNGAGCPKCGIERARLKNKMTVEDFIERAHALQAYRYNYTLVKFNNLMDKIKIICPIHGVFTQKAGTHLQGCGCPNCASDKFTPKNKLNTETFIEYSKIKHGTKYGYSLTNYVNSITAVKIICPIHGAFEQTPNSHLDGNGCPSCAIIYRSNKLKLTQEEFILRAINRHGTIYDYSNAVYIGAKTKVLITCKKHGAFLQVPGSHIFGAGCPHCLESHGEKYIASILDLLNIPYEREKKFPDCRDNRPLLFDFYIQKFNMCIEYDGSQHFYPCKYFGGYLALERAQIRDKIKNRYCCEKQITLIRFSYRDSTEKISGTLYRILKSSMQV